MEVQKLKIKKTRFHRAVILSQRDYDILEYVLEMKFASLQNIFQKFFSVLKNGEEAKSNEWAIRRLQQLSQANFLKGAHSFSHKQKFYLLTPKGYQAIKSGKFKSDLVKPSLVIDHRTFDHDRLVLESRIALENQRAASRWISDKRLRSSRELAGGLTLSNVPDGLYINEKGERVAFELEFAKKTQKALLDKIKRYVVMMRSQDTKTKVFDKVLYVCAGVYTYEYIKKEIQIYGDLFEVMTLDQFFGKLSGPSEGLSPSLEK